MLLQNQLRKPFQQTWNVTHNQPIFWGTNGTVVMKPKSGEACIMVSGFIDERHRYLALTQEEYERAKVTDPTIWMHARVYLEYGKAKEGFWNSDTFMSQMKNVVRIAEVKYLKAKGWKHVWIFDRSSCHGAKTDDSLDVSKMNVNTGGKQHVMRDGWSGVNHIP